MSVAKRKRKDMVNSFAKLGKALGRPMLSGKKFRSIGDAIEAGRKAAALEAKLARKKKK